MNENIQGKVIVITGASSGLGRGDGAAASAQGATRRAGRAPTGPHPGAGATS